MSKYQPLAKYLRELTVDEITVNFEEIEGIIQTNLPPVARRSRNWWTNHPSIAAARGGWLAAGWEIKMENQGGRKIKSLDLMRKVVTFCRASK